MNEKKNEDVDLLVKTKEVVERRISVLTYEEIQQLADFYNSNAILDSVGVAARKLETDYLRDFGDIRHRVNAAMQYISDIRIKLMVTIKEGSEFSPESRILVVCILSLFCITNNKDELFDLDEIRKLLTAMDILGW
ncbi:MAG: hypothetical protein LBL47_03620 [Lactobacillus sp.]|jgi:uncharacterized membrane protein|nr:hypothetical protein [Lactobacillus sp.]